MILGLEDISLKHGSDDNRKMEMWQKPPQLGSQLFLIASNKRKQMPTWILTKILVIFWFSILHSFKQLGYFFTLIFIHRSTHSDNRFQWFSLFVMYPRLHIHVQRFWIVPPSSILITDLFIGGLATSYTLTIIPQDFEFELPSANYFAIHFLNWLFYDVKAYSIFEFQWFCFVAIHITEIWIKSNHKTDLNKNSKYIVSAK